MPQVSDDKLMTGPTDGRTVPLTKFLAGEMFHSGKESGQQKKLRIPGLSC